MQICIVAEPLPRTSAVRPFFRCAILACCAPAESIPGWSSTPEHDASSRNLFGGTSTESWRKRWAQLDQSVRFAIIDWPRRIDAMVGIYGVLVKKPVLVRS
jgi:hypothetical protein